MPHVAQLDRVWRVPEARLAAGLLPGYVGAVRFGERTEMRAAGTRALATDSAPMTADTVFRIASLTKPIAGALTLSLVQDAVLALDDPIATWLPEAANPRVLQTPDGPLDRTVAASRPITVRDLLAGTCGWGVIFEPSPLQAALVDSGAHPSVLPQQLTRDEFVAAIAALPLACQPGDGFHYDTGISLLGVLLSRATGTPLSDLLAARVTGPLGMTDTSFWTDDVARLATAYSPGPHGLELLDPPEGVWAGPRDFEQLGGGLLSTVGDLMRFFTAMADGGGPVLTAESVALMTADALTDRQRPKGGPIPSPGMSWGLGVGVDIADDDPWMSVGRWGWEGGSGTTAHVDPTRNVVGVLLTQRAMTGPQDGWNDFWTDIAESADARP